MQLEKRKCKSQNGNKEMRPRSSSRSKEIHFARHCTCYISCQTRKGYDFVDCQYKSRSAFRFEADISLMAA